MEELSTESGWKRKVHAVTTDLNTLPLLALHPLTHGIPENKSPVQKPWRGLKKAVVNILHWEVYIGTTIGHSLV